MNEKRNYEPSEIRIVLFCRDLLITSGGTLEEGNWDEFDFSAL